MVSERDVPPGPGSVREQLEGAVRDLWSLMEESGDSYVVFLDRRRLRARVEQTEGGAFAVRWEGEEGGWITCAGELENPREAAFHAYQGPH